MEENLFEELKEALFACDEEAAKEVAKRVIDEGKDPYQAIQKGLTPGIREMGDRFERGEIFLPHLMMAGEAMEAAVRILETKMTREEMEKTKRGTIVLGTIQGDIHNIGKNIVGMMLKAGGYEVIDLGVDVAPSKFIDEAEKAKADIIAVSALMTFTAWKAKTVVEYMESLGVRNKYKLIVGGGALNEQMSGEIGADGYAEDAIKTVVLINRMIGK